MAAAGSGQALLPGGSGSGASWGLGNRWGGLSGQAAWGGGGGGSGSGVAGTGASPRSAGHARTAGHAAGRSWDGVTSQAMAGAMGLYGHERSVGGGGGALHPTCPPGEQPAGRSWGTLGALPHRPGSAPLSSAVHHSKLLQQQAQQGRGQQGQAPLRSGAPGVRLQALHTDGGSGETAAHSVAPGVVCRGVRVTYAVQGERV